MIRFLNSSVTIAPSHWAHHARFLVKLPRDKVVRVFDPWKQDFSQRSQAIKDIVQAATDAGWKAEFVARPLPDQAPGEGSCGFVAFARSVMAARLGADSITTLPLDPADAVLASRVISKFRGGKRRR